MPHGLCWRASGLTSHDVFRPINVYAAVRRETAETRLIKACAALLFKMRRFSFKSRRWRCQSFWSVALRKPLAFFGGELAQHGSSAYALLLHGICKHSKSIGTAHAQALRNLMLCCDSAIRMPVALQDPAVLGCSLECCLVEDSDLINHMIPSGPFNHHPCRRPHL